MSLAVISLLALIVVIIVSCISTRNIGIMALGVALVIGHYLGDIKVDEILKGYPTSLFIMLAGTTFLFSIAQNNGTLEKVTKYVIKGVKGKVALLPILLFFIALVIGAAGPGPTVTAALLAPTVMLLAKEIEVNPLLLAVMAGNGGHAGGMSPIAIGGIITTGLTNKLGLGDISMLIWFNNVWVHFAASVIAYFVFGGHKLLKNRSAAESSFLANMKVEPFSKEQWLTLIGLAVYIVSVIGFNMDIGLGAFLIGAILILLKTADEDKAVKSMPWGAILMVTGVTVMITLMTKVGGIDLFAALIAKLASTSTISLVTGFVAGLISAYASTTGVILATFVPMAPILLEKVGASSNELIPLISTIVSCGFVVDMSPLSTSGAIYLANAHASENKSVLFKKLLIWGLSMAAGGAVIAWISFTLLAIP
ncbi:di/tricarboxylate transporter [Anaerospora hongkongensis]|uniref:Di/tricarboxylate transporter n=1 Tax=Anaerospora hongkongensis TaxID=244830 RepID=A0A4R1Q136_9FIRM|nr:SLC13 family permease [Anaerospora hongkongensis]TCL39401.1 di/tricarboxylate transporter [Anaerospora hongkongensis]